MQAVAGRAIRPETKPDEPGRINRSRTATAATGLIILVLQSDRGESVAVGADSPLMDDANLLRNCRRVISTLRPKKATATRSRRCCWISKKNEKKYTVAPDRALSHRSAPNCVPDETMRLPLHLFIGFVLSFFVVDFLWISSDVGYMTPDSRSQVCDRVRF
ncbi:hypothetical protein J6590_079763 [Homalodisca vitripennis]|nr:hypothetical protein J6590_095861 [Homalodisca vitripennis]KAG8275765.1 hypothetical protein J6590_079763 [Homalodisca vitripennis]